LHPSNIVANEDSNSRASFHTVIDNTNIIQS